MNTFFERLKKDVGNFVEKIKQQPVRRPIDPHASTWYGILDDRVEQGFPDPALMSCEELRERSRALDSSKYARSVPLSQPPRYRGSASTKCADRRTGARIFRRTS